MIALDHLESFLIFISSFGLKLHESMSMNLRITNHQTQQITMSHNFSFKKIDESSFF